MQYRTNYFALFFIASITGILIYFISNASYFSFSEPVFLNHNIKSFNFSLYKEGVFTASYPSNMVDVDGSILEPRGVSFVFKNKINNDSKKSPFFLGIIYEKNINKESLSINKWWEEFGPQNQHKAPYPLKNNLIKIKNNDAYYTLYSGSDGFGYDYYNLVIVYIPHGTDIYEVHGFKLPDNPSSDLTPEDVQAAKEYEKIFDQILQSIEFLD